LESNQPRKGVHELESIRRNVPPLGRVPELL
jgi:hypothetical protein